MGVYLKRLMARRAANEQTRLLYVATTRAKKTLYLSAAPKAKQDGTVIPRTGTLLASLWPALSDAFKAGERRPQFMSKSAADIAGEAAWSRDGRVEPQFGGDNTTNANSGTNDAAASSNAAARHEGEASSEVAALSNVATPPDAAGPVRARLR